ncbi:MAG: DUF2271 domain-containing protein [Pseudomonadota bacterium]
MKLPIRGSGVACRRFAGLLSLLAVALPASADLWQADLEGVLGTSLNLKIEADPARFDDASFERVQARVIARIEALEAALSSYRDDSELSRLNRERSLPDPSDDLRAVLQHCDEWARNSQNRFSCKLGSLRATWRAAVVSQELPERTALRRSARSLLRAPLWQPAGDGIALTDNVSLDINGLGKGYVIDQVVEALIASEPVIDALALEIGGDGRYWQRNPDAALAPWPVAVQTGTNGANGATARIAVANAAVAGSGPGERGYQIGRRTFSAILAPRDGWPITKGNSAYIRAPTATHADAIATAVAAMPGGEAIDWINELVDVEALILLPGGLQLRSDGWLSADDRSGAGAATLMTLDYVIPDINVPRYRKPYLAVWLTQAGSRTVVRNLLMLGEDQRWAREMSRWWRTIGRRPDNDMSSYARPTRRAGTYALTWDGRDNAGQPVDPATVVLNIEAAREDGGHDFLAVPLEPGVPRNLERKGELGALALRWP